MTKEELLAQIHVDRRQLDRCLFYFHKDERGVFVPGDRLKFTEEEMHARGVVGDWSLKDLLAYLGAWETHFLDWYDRRDSLQQPALAVTQAEIDRLNQQIYESNKDRPLRDVIAGFRATHIRLLKTLASTPEEELASRRSLALKGMSLEEYIGTVIWEHDRWAKGQIRRWMKAHRRSGRDKNALLEEIEREHRRLEQNLAFLTDDQLTEAGVVGDWSVKDLLAHLTAWENLFLGWYRAGLRGEVPQTPAPGFTWKDLDRLNRQIYEENLDRLLESVKADFRRSYQETLKVVERIPADDLYTVSLYPWMGKGTLIGYIRANTSSHYRWAKEQVRKWTRRHTQ